MARGHSRVAKLYEKDTVRISLDDGIGDALRKFADDIREKALRPAAAAAANVLADEMTLRAPVFQGDVYINKTGKAAGNPNAKPGQLKRAVFQYHDPKQSGGNRQVYLVGVSKKRAPHWSFVEFGTVRMAARPFIRPAYDAKISEALKAGSDRLAEKIKELTK